MFGTPPSNPVPNAPRLVGGRRASSRNGMGHLPPGAPEIPPQSQLYHAAVSPLVPQGFPENVQGEMTDCFKDLAILLGRTLGISDLAPHIHPPFYSKSLCFLNRAVINIPAAFDAAAFLGGVNLASAESAFTGGIVGFPGTSGQINELMLLNPAAVAPPFEAQTVMLYKAPAGHVAVFKSFGVTVENSTNDAARVFLDVAGGPNVGSTPPNPFISSADQDSQQDTMIIVPDNKSLRIKIQNLDTGSAILTTVALCGWEIPIRQWRDTLKSMTDTPGYGLCDGEV